jgi:hypothetical protein
MQTSNGTNAFEVYSNTTQTTLNATGTLSLNGSSGGYVGINTTSPGTTLDVNGNINVGSTLYDRANTNYYLNPSGNIMPYAANLNGGVNVNGVVTAGNSASTNGSVVMQGVYGSGALAVWGTERSSGAPVVGYGVSPSTSAAGSFLSSTGVALARAALTVGGNGNITFYTGPSQTIAVGSAVTMSPVMTVLNGGNIGIGTTNPQAKLQVGSGTVSDAGFTARIVASDGNQVAIGYGSIFGSSIQGRSSSDSNSNLAINAWGGNVGIGTTTPSTAGLVVATNVSGAGINMNNNRIINVGTPVNAADAATKNYVDSAIAGGSGSSVGYWTLSGSNLYPSGSYNVGLGGQTSPVYNLDIGTTAGTVNIRGSTGQLFTNNISPNTGGTVYINNSSNLNVAGIVTAPQGNVGSGASGGNMPLNVWTNNANGYNINLVNQNPSQGNWLIGVEGNNNPHPGAFSVYSQNTSAFTALEIDTSGNYYFNRGNATFSGEVGINTSPSTNLDVNGNINVGSVLYDRANTNYYVNPSGNIMAYAANLGGGVNIANGNLSVEGMQENVIQSSVSSGDMTILLGNLSIGGAQVFVSYSGGWANDVGYFVLNVPYWGTALDVQQGIQSSSNNRIQFYYKYLNDGAVYVAMTITNNSPSKSYGMSARVEIVSDVYHSATTPFSGYSPATVRSSVSEGNATFAGGLTTNGTLYSAEVDNGTVTGATTINWASGNTQTLVLGASPIALTFNNGQAGAHYTLALEQDGTGSRTVTWPGNVRWSSGVAPTLTTAANKTDYVEFVYDGLSSTFDGVGFNANF